MSAVITRPVKRRADEDPLALLAARQTAGPGWSYKLAADVFALDMPALGLDPQFDDGAMSITYPFAASQGRDRQGDFLEVSGIDTRHHRRYPLAFIDHGKTVCRWPLGLDEDPKTGEYKVWIDEDAGLAWCTTWINQHVKEPVDAYKMYRAGILRAGSIGYRPMRATRMAADPAAGDLKPGFHLIEVELLETTLACLPANGDAVRRCLEMGVEGEQLSPGFKALLEPMAAQAPEMVVGGWQTKDAAGPAMSAIDLCRGGSFIGPASFGVVKRVRRKKKAPEKKA